jgi:alkylhydroperoxidase family enzyme
MTARIAPVEAPYVPKVQAVFDRFPKDWSPPFQLFRVLANDPQLLERFVAGAVSYLPETHVSVRQREVLLLRVTARCGCAYEWGMRVHYFAELAGLNDALVTASVHGDATSPGWTTEDQLIVRMADELHESATLSDALWIELSPVFSKETILQLLMLAAYYRGVAYIANGLRLDLEPVVGMPFPQTAQDSN